MEMRLKRLGQVTTGRINYYGIAKRLARLKEIEGWIRRRIKSMYLETMEKDKYQI